MATRNYLILLFGSSLVVSNYLKLLGWWVMLNLFGRSLVVIKSMGYKNEPGQFDSHALPPISICSQRNNSHIYEAKSVSDSCC